MEAADRIEQLEAEVEKWKKLDSEAATYVESVICMRTDFTGNPPYVGWEGLGLALNEALDERDRLRALLDPTQTGREMDKAQTAREE
jgi:hypothetical protein